MSGHGTPSASMLQNVSNSELQAKIDKMKAQIREYNDDGNPGFGFDEEAANHPELMGADDDFTESEQVEFQG